MHAVLTHLLLTVTDSLSLLRDVGLEGLRGCPGEVATWLRPPWTILL